MIIEILKVTLLRQVEIWQKLYEEKVQAEEERYWGRLGESDDDDVSGEFQYKPTAFKDIVWQVFWDKFQTAEQCANWLWIWFWRIMRFFLCMVSTIITCIILTETNSVTSKRDLALTALAVFFSLVMANEMLIFGEVGVLTPTGIADKSSQPDEVKNDTERPDNQKDSTQEEVVRVSRRTTTVTERQVKVLEEGVNVPTSGPPKKD